jgi:hypothetical protein
MVLDSATVSSKTGQNIPDGVFKLKCKGGKTVSARELVGSSDHQESGEMRETLEREARLLQLKPVVSDSGKSKLLRVRKPDSTCCWLRPAPKKSRKATDCFFNDELEELLLEAEETEETEDAAPQAAAAPSAGDVQAADPQDEAAAVPTDNANCRQNVDKESAEDKKGRFIGAIENLRRSAQQVILNLLTPTGIASSGVTEMRKVYKDLKKKLDDDACMLKLQVISSAGGESTPAAFAVERTVAVLSSTSAFYCEDMMLLRNMLEDLDPLVVGQGAKTKADVLQSAMKRAAYMDIPFSWLNEVLLTKRLREALECSDLDAFVRHMQTRCDVDNVDLDDVVDLGALDASTQERFRTTWLTKAILALLPERYTSTSASHIAPLRVVECLLKGVAEKLEDDVSCAASAALKDLRLVVACGIGSPTREEAAPIIDALLRIKSVPGNVMPALESQKAKMLFGYVSERCRKTSLDAESTVKLEACLAQARQLASAELEVDAIGRHTKLWIDLVTEVTALQTRASGATKESWKELIGEFLQLRAEARNGLNGAYAFSFWTWLSTKYAFTPTVKAHADSDSDSKLNDGLASAEQLGVDVLCNPLLADAAGADNIARTEFNTRAKAMGEFSKALQVVMRSQKRD